jgi:hypothetical protein
MPRARKAQRSDWPPAGRGSQGFYMRCTVLQAKAPQPLSKGGPSDLGLCVSHLFDVWRAVSAGAERSGWHVAAAATMEPFVVLDVDGVLHPLSEKGLPVNAAFEDLSKRADEDQEDDGLCVFPAVAGESQQHKLRTDRRLQSTVECQCGPVPCPGLSLMTHPPTTQVSSSRTAWPSWLERSQRQARRSCCRQPGERRLRSGVPSTGSCRSSASRPPLRRRRD